MRNLSPAGVNMLKHDQVDQERQRVLDDMSKIRNIGIGVGTSRCKISETTDTEDQRK